MCHSHILCQGTLRIFNFANQKFLTCFSVLRWTVSLDDNFFLFFFSVEDCMAGDVNLFLNDNKLDIAEIEVMIAGIFLIACR